MSGAWPFVGAWGIWLAGYGLLLAADYTLRAAGASSTGVSADPLWVAIPVTVSAGAAGGFFIAAAGRWRLPWRLALLALQVPPAYVAAVSLGYGYLCLVGDTCP